MFRGNKRRGAAYAATILLQDLGGRTLASENVPFIELGRARQKLRAVLRSRQAPTVMLVGHYDIDGAVTAIDAEFNEPGKALAPFVSRVERAIADELATVPTPAPIEESIPMAKKPPKPPSQGVALIRFVIYTPYGETAVADATVATWARTRKTMLGRLRAMEVASAPAALVSQLYDANARLLDVSFELNLPGARLRPFVDLLRMMQAGASRRAGPIQQKNPPRKKRVAKKPPKRRRVVGPRRSDGSAPSRHGSVSGVLDEIRGKKPGKPCRAGFAASLQVLATNTLQGVLRPHDLKAGLQRFTRCDWGDVNAAVARANNRNTHTGGGVIVGLYESPTGVLFKVVGSPPEGVMVAMLPGED